MPYLSELRLILATQLGLECFGKEIAPVAIPKSPDVSPSSADWTDVAHFSLAKAIIGATFYLVAGIGLTLLLAYRIPLPFFFNERVAQTIVGIAILFCAVMVIGRLQIILPGRRCFFRAGRDGIWYKQAGTLDTTPGRSKDTRISWHEVTRWYPHTLRMNGSALWKVIVFETINGKHPVQIHLYKERQDQIIANIETASR